MAIFVIGILILIVLILAGRLAYTNRQLRLTDRILARRLKEKSREKVNLGLGNRLLNQLAGRMNACLVQEEEMRAENEAQEQRLRELVADVSHDLRTPLTAVKGYLQLLDREGLGEEQNMQLDIISRHTIQLEHCIDQFFEYSCLLAGEQEVRMERVNLTNVTMEQLADYFQMLEKQGLQVQYEQEEPVYVQADPELVKRILQNLLRNCLRYAKESVSVEIKKENGAVLCVSNRLADVQRIDTEQLFERFYIGENQSRSSNGLGLSIVRMLAQEMEGNAWAYQEGPYLTICVRLLLQT